MVKPFHIRYNPRVNTKGLPGLALGLGFGLSFLGAPINTIFMAKGLHTS